MRSELIEAAGGLGLFLLGMVILTEGLRGLAGDALQRTMRRFTRSPVSGALTGLGITALVQSSSATTVTAVGFAGAGLLTFPQALGLVFGANVGTTVTGWAVALLGFKVDLSAILPPLILAGALLRLFGRGRPAKVGHALAGFALVFLGIDLLSSGMGALEGVVTPEDFPPDTLVGRLTLVAIGAAITIVTQSSSAGVATALAAVHTDTIGFVQACALVIGMDVGTTVTAAFATVGGSVAARRTGFAHVIYNLLTAVGALLLLPVYVGTLRAALPDAIDTDPELCLVAFHTLFNSLGVLAVLPVAGAFARLLERIVPERPTRFTERLDRSLLREPGVALRAVAPTLGELSLQSFGLLATGLSGQPPPEERRGLLLLAVEQTADYLDGIEGPARGDPADARELAALHVIDQLRRLLARLQQQGRMAQLAREPALAERARGLSLALPGPLADTAAAARRLESLGQSLAAERDDFRRQLLDRAARDELRSEDAIARLDGWRWLERVTHHVVRILHHTDQLLQERPSTTRADLEPEAEPEGDV